MTFLNVATMRSRENIACARRRAPSPRRCPERAVVQQAMQRSAQRRLVARWDDKAADAVLVDPRHASRQIRADDRPSRRHRLDLHYAEGLGPRDRRQDEHVTRLIERRQIRIGNPAGKQHAVGKPLLGDERSKASLRAVPPRR